MSKPLLPRFALILLLWLSVPQHASADQGQADFDLTLDSAAAGVLTVEDRRPVAGYDIAATLDLTATTALDFSATSSGDVTGQRLVPLHYTATDPARGDADVTFSGGAPYVAVDAPLAHPHWIANLSALKGALDPLTAFWSLARDVPVADACVLRVFLFDGRHLAQVVMFVPEISDGTVICQGEYRRLNGFTPGEMVQKQRFAFFLTYGDAGRGMVHLREARFETLTGFGTLKRR
jgi:hypothetical protein